MKKINVQEIKTTLAKVMLDKNRRSNVQLAIVSFVFFCAGLIFSIINFINAENELGAITSSFAGISLIIFIVTVTVKRYRVLLEVLFVAAVMLMFLYFIVSGGAGDHGFSTYWIMLLPFLAMLVLGLKVGTIVSNVMLVCIIFFLWIPGGSKLLRWTPDATFSLRFPLVYLAALASSFLFELSQVFADGAISEMNNKLISSAHHDYLTGLTNRHGLQEICNNQKKLIGTSQFRTAACMLIDVDNFKYANDTYGHMFGDDVLIRLARILRNKRGEYAIRFGGDEFILLFTNTTDFELKQIAEQIRREAQEETFPDHPEYHFTISIGIASSPVTEDYRIESVIELADYQSSRAKKNGKNAIYSISFDDVTAEINKEANKKKPLF